MTRVNLGPADRGQELLYWRERPLPPGQATSDGLVTFDELGLLRMLS